MNTYHDFINKVDTKESSDDRTLVDSIMTPREILGLAIASFIGFVAATLALISPFIILPILRGNFWSDHADEARDFAVLVLVGVVLTWAYAAKPLKLKHRALGDVVIFICFGPLLVTGAYLLQVRSLSLEPFLFSCPLGLITVAILHANNTRDIESDKRAGATTLAQILGFQWSYYFYIALWIVSFLILLAISLLYASSEMPSPPKYTAWIPSTLRCALLCLSPLLLSWRGVGECIRRFHRQDWSELCPLTAQTGLALSVGLSIAVLLSGVPAVASASAAAP